MLTGLEKFACCHPLAVSLVKVTVASRVPEALQRLPTWVPVFVEPLQNRMPLIKPDVAAVNLTPTSTAFGSFATGGVLLGLKRLNAEDGVTVYETPGLGVPRLMLSSTARDSIVYVPGAGAVNV